MFVCLGHRPARWATPTTPKFTSICLGNLGVGTTVELRGSRGTIICDQSDKGGQVMRSSSAATAASGAEDPNAPNRPGR